ncbi:MAG: hypothetical protein AB7I33_03575 [Gemmatimonadales bacterium]
MAYRRFTDQQGNEWEVQDRSRSEWEFHPVSGNPGRNLSVRPPGYETDPFELSEEELQRLMGEADGPGRSRPAKSPFAD